jgi:tRNA A-37 threonylcarbamoyl transferase component Bud32
VRLQLISPAEHQPIVDLPWGRRLAEWPIDGLRDPGGMHRHVVRFLEVGATTYVLKELPDELAEREYRLLRKLADAGLPTADVIGIAIQRANSDGEGILITRHLDFSLPYRVLLSGRGLKIAYLGERLLDALVGLLVRLHAQGFFWGDCSLSNTLFRRDAGALVAFVIDVETGELHDHLSEGQRLADLQIAIENVAGGLYDLQLGGHLADGIDPFETALAVEDRYHQLWTELTAEEEFAADETFKVDRRLRRLHDLGFDVGEVELVSDGAGDRIRLVPRVVEFGYHGPRLTALTGISAGENQARRLLHDIRLYGAELEKRSGRRVPENVVAARWLDRVYEPTLTSIPDDLRDRLEPAELYHQLLEHRWYLSEREGKDVGVATAVMSYVDEVLRAAPDEHVVIDPETIELPTVYDDAREPVDGAPFTL